ncbi:MAG: LysE family transporter [Candidatus Verstraetearchaeota archaeon]|nr:LysE family transporter [Candidatus Verstraetearchaeota archaeon]
MDWLGFAVLVVVLTASGALAPGPLFFATLLMGVKKGGWSGFKVAVGHSAVELPLVLLLALGLLTVLNVTAVKLALGIGGGVVLIALGLLQLRDGVNAWRRRVDFFEVDEKKGSGAARLMDNPFFVGAVLSAFNPFFILWWLTIGAQLVLEALALAALVGVLIMYVLHVWMDYAWLTVVARAAHTGRKLLSPKSYAATLAVFGVVLILFGAHFISKVAFEVPILPL